jgi:DNA-directed RNA polymerase beta' subunit
MLTEIEALTPVLKKAVKHASDLSDMIETGRDKSDPGKMSFILKKLSEADEYIESMKKSKDLISFSIQRVIHTITEGYELDNSKKDNAGELSLFLYNGLLEGALFNKKILQKMKIMV